MELVQLDADLSICKITSVKDVDFSKKFVFLAKTDDEISLVCLTKDVPTDVIAHEDNWKALRITGILSFDMIGILAKIASILADNQISIFVISTYNTDYLLVKSGHLAKTVAVLTANGYIVL